MKITTLIRVPSETLLSIAITNYVAFASLSTIRKDLQILISECVRPHLGNFVAPIVGNQLGLAYAVRVTSMYAQGVSTVACELIGAIYELFATIFFELKPEKRDPFFLNLTIKIAAYAASYFATTYFCNYGMPLVSMALRASLPVVARLIGMPVLSSVTLIMPLYLAPVTFVVGDIVGALAWHVTYATLRRAEQHVRCEK